MREQQQQAREKAERVGVEFEEGTLKLSPSEASKFWTKKGKVPGSEIEFFKNDPKGFELYLNAKRQEGDKRAETELEFFQRDPKNYAEFKNAQATGKEAKVPGLISWDGARSEVSGRFGRQDPTGQWSITPSLQGMHRVAKQRLAEHQVEGKLSPLEAANESEQFARRQELNFWKSMDKFNGNEEKQGRVQEKFTELFGYVPSKRPRELPKLEEKGFFGSLL